MVALGPRWDAEADDRMFWGSKTPGRRRSAAELGRYLGHVAAEGGGGGGGGGEAGA